MNQHRISTSTTPTTNVERIPSLPSAVLFQLPEKTAKLKTNTTDHDFNGARVPWDQIMENKFEYLSDPSGHLAETFLKNYCSYPKLLQLLCRDLPVVTGQRLTISVIISKRGF